MMSHAVSFLQSYALNTLSVMQEPAAASPLSNVVLYGVMVWLGSTVALAVWMRRFNLPLYVD